MSEHTACRIVGQPRGTQRYVPTLKPDENELTRNIVLIASNYGRYGYLRDELLNGEILERPRSHSGYRAMALPL